MSIHVTGFQSFLVFLHHFALAKLANSSIRVMCRRPPTVNSREYRTLFNYYDFHWLLMVAKSSENSDQSSDTVAEIRRNYQSKRKLDGKSIANFVKKNTIFPPQNPYYNVVTFISNIHNHDGLPIP